MGSVCIVVSAHGPQRAERAEKTYKIRDKRGRTIKKRQDTRREEEEEEEEEKRREEKRTEE